MQPIRPSTSLRNNVFETGKLFDGRGDKVSSNAREGERRVARGTLRTKIPSLSTAYTVYLFESREREYKTEEFVRNGTGLFSIIIIIQESWTSIDRDIFFCFFPKKCAFQGKIPKFERSVNSMIDQWPPLSDLYPAYSEIADILLTASRPIVPRSMNRFANAFPFRRWRIGLAISAQPIGISRATPSSSSLRTLDPPKTKGFSWKMLTRFALIVKIIFHISRDWKETTLSRILWNHHHRRSK